MQKPPQNVLRLQLFILHKFAPLLASDFNKITNLIPITGLYCFISQLCLSSYMFVRHVPIQKRDESKSSKFQMCNTINYLVHVVYKLNCQLYEALDIMLSTDLNVGDQAAITSEKAEIISH